VFNKMAVTPKWQVSFSDAVSSPVSCSSDKTYEAEEEESFYEITTSEADSLGYSSSDDEYASRLDMIIQGAYSCNPSYFSSLTSGAAERNSLLLFDKDLCDGDGSGRVTVWV